MGRGVYNLNSVLIEFIHTRTKRLLQLMRIYMRKFGGIYEIDILLPGLAVKTQITLSAIWVWHQDNIHRKERRMDRKLWQHCI